MILKLPNLKRIRTGDPSVISFELPERYLPAYRELIKCHPDYLDVEIGPHRKPRTTGAYSQNKHINGHIQQIANETGNDFDTVKLYCKTEALALNYPFDTINGRVFPWSETRIDTIQAGYLIDSIHRLAAEMAILLIEE